MSSEPLPEVSVEPLADLREPPLSSPGSVVLLLEPVEVGALVLREPPLSSPGSVVLLLPDKVGALVLPEPPLSSPGSVVLLWEAVKVGGPVGSSRRPP